MSSPQGALELFKGHGRYSKDSLFARATPNKGSSGQSRYGVLSGVERMQMEQYFRWKSCLLLLLRLRASKAKRTSVTRAGRATWST